MTDRLIVTGKNDAVLRGIDRLEKQMRFAAKNALNATAKRMATEGNRTISSVFDRPTPRTASAVKVFSGAKDGRLSAAIGIYNGNKGFAADDPRAKSARKGSVFPSGYLAHHVDGGTRVEKTFERRLIQAGVMPFGMYAIYAKRSGYLDRYGNLPQTKIKQILSYFQTFKESGHNNNMKASTIDKRRRGKIKGMKFGMVYFVSTGQRFGGLGMRLPRGVWERHYPNGPAGKTFIRPVLLFVPSATYRQRFDFYGVMGKAAESLPEEFDRALTNALRTAR